MLAYHIAFNKTNTKILTKKHAAIPEARKEAVILGNDYWEALFSLKDLQTSKLKMIGTNPQVYKGLDLKAAGLF